MCVLTICQYKATHINFIHVPYCVLEIIKPRHICALWTLEFWWHRYITVLVIIIFLFLKCKKICISNLLLDILRLYPPLVNPMLYVTSCYNTEYRKEAQVMACCLLACCWSNVNLPSKVFCGVHLSAVSHEVQMNVIHNKHLEIILLKLLPYIPGTNELSSQIPPPSYTGELCVKGNEITLTLYVLNFSDWNINMCSHFMSFLHTDMP